MAEDKKKKPKEETTNGEKKEKPLFLILVIMLVLIIFLAAGFVYLILFKSSGSSKSTTSTTTTTETAVQSAELPANTYSFEKEFLVNLSDTDKTRYLKVSISLGYSSKKLTAELTESAPGIRDAINSVLRSKQSTEFTTKGTEDLKKEIISRVNPLLKKGKISDVYFSDIIVQ